MGRTSSSAARQVGSAESGIPQLFDIAIAQAASPDRARLNLQRFLTCIGEAVQASKASPESAESAVRLDNLADSPRTVELLVNLFAGSQFLTEILLRHPAYLTRLSDRGGLARLRTLEEFEADARIAVASGHPRDGPEPSPDPPSYLTSDSLGSLHRFQQWELLRIGACDLLGLLDLPSVTSQLSYLAESIVRVCLEVAARQLGADRSGLVVLAMGKLGGGELNYSSDIDLLFLAESSAEASRRLGERLIAILARSTPQGFLYRVDMRLRPWGQVGPLVSTVDGYLRYLEQHARLWEKQALLRARAIAGEVSVGSAFLARAERLLFSTDPNAVRGEVHAMKQLTEARLRELGQEWGEVKLGAGSIRDVEFVVQYLQLAHGAEHAALRSGNTIEAMARLAEHELLSAEEHRVLQEGYVFLRTVEHYLQILDYRQTHRLPSAPGDLRYLAHRLGFQGLDAAPHFVTRYTQHAAAIRAVYLHHLEPRLSPAESRSQSGASQHRAVRPQGSTDPGIVESGTGGSMPPPDQREPSDDIEVRRHISRMAPSYAAAFSSSEIRRHSELASRLNGRNPVEVRAEPLGEVPEGGDYVAEGEDLWRVTVVAYDYLGELSLICGLLFALGYSIVDGQVFTYEPHHEAGASAAPIPYESGLPHAETLEAARKIVDVFTVRAVAGVDQTPSQARDSGQWLRYASNLAALLRLLQDRRQRDAQGELAKLVATAVATRGQASSLHPVDIEIDNDASERYTVLRIDAPDTVGFLYELSNALALNGIHIAHVSVATHGHRVHDALHVTDAQGRKITGTERQRELRAATVLVKHFTHLLPHSPNPESALLHFHEYLGELLRRPSWPDDLASLERPEVLGALARLLGVSEFLWDDFLRMQYANLFPVVRDVGALGEARPKQQLAADLERALEAAGSRTATASPAAADEGATPSSEPPEAASTRYDAQREALNAFKDREMFRIDMRHILGHLADFGRFSQELTDLVETVVTAGLALAEAQLLEQYGQPRDEAGSPVPWCVGVLGKCGGYELGYASDIEVMFIYGGPGSTLGPKVISAAEYYDKLVTEFSRAIWARREGIFEIDLDLRPYGKAGSLAVSLDSFRRYFAPGGPAWAYERQALIKLRAIAGDLSLGKQLEALRDTFVYSGAAFDVAAMRAMRERQLRHLTTPGTFNVKYSLGGLVDVEYVVQALQMTHGHSLPGLRLTNTRAAIEALAGNGIISEENAARLSEAHLFLQNLINALRVVRGNSKDLTVPPEESEEFAFLARRLGYGVESERLGTDLTHHMEWVRRLNSRLLG